MVVQLRSSKKYTICFEVVQKINDRRNKAISEKCPNVRVYRDL